MTYKTVAVIALILGIISFALILLVIFQKAYIERKRKRDLNIQKQLVKRFLDFEEFKMNCSGFSCLKHWFVLTQQIELSETAKLRFYDYLLERRIIHRLIRNLNSIYQYKRKRAIAYLSLFQTKLTLSALANRLNREPQFHIRLMIVNALKRDLTQEFIDKILQSLIKGRRFYQRKTVLILKKYINPQIHDLSPYFAMNHIEIKEFLCEIAQDIYCIKFKEPLYQIIKEIEEHYQKNNILYLAEYPKARIDKLYYIALSAAANLYDFDLSISKYLNNVDDEVIRLSANSMVKFANTKTIQTLTSYASMTYRDHIYSDAIIEICDRVPEMYTEVYNLFLGYEEKRKKYLLAAVLSKKMDYLILSVENKDDLAEFINAIVNSRYTVNLINWMNANKNRELEDQIIKIIQPIAENNYEFYQELNQFLDSNIFKRMGYLTLKYPKALTEDPRPDTAKLHWLIKLLIILVIIIPFVFVLSNLEFIITSDILSILTKYMIDLNDGFIIYYVFANFFYLLFVVVALVEFSNQSKLWSIKSERYLYETGVLSPISVIVPAYNEELTIVESVRSLLSLEYPLYEVIVVNDGSKDKTLNTLIEAFDLKRIDYAHKEIINTNHVKAAYRSKFYNKLLVIDKENGGKADTLNVGINFSNYDYICGIDADSIIESDGLLKMMSSVLDSDEIVLALGGSIVAVNGSTVDHGYVEKYALPKTFLTRAQSIEYIRAFNTGRLAFSKMRSLLIISGAFGLFEKRMLIRVGGYLAASSFKKKTVGEDMELVVRITREATESNLPHRMKYVPTARCYTEIPSARKTLFSQRNRWQRGLIETLSNHRKMIFNPKYGASGLFGMPYYFLFEMIAPIFELQIYTTLIIGLIFGIFSGPHLLLLFVVTCLLGVVYSVSALFVQEKYFKPLSLKETFILVFYAVIENFGWRQFVSIYRAFGYFASLKSGSSWGSMTRTGFKK